MVESGDDRFDTDPRTERVPSRSFPAPRPPDRLPPPSPDNFLAAGGAVAVLALFLVTALGNPDVLSLGVPLLPYFFILTVGVWRVRPEREHRASFRLCFTLVLLQIAAYLLFLWPVALATMAGQNDVRYAVDRSLGTVVTLAFLLGWIPAFVLLSSARRAGWLMIAAAAGPLATLGYVAVATPWVLR